MCVRALAVYPSTFPASCEREGEEDICKHARVATVVAPAATKLGSSKAERRARRHIGVLTSQHVSTHAASVARRVADATAARAACSRCGSSSYRGRQTHHEDGHEECNKLHHHQDHQQHLIISGKGGRMRAEALATTQKGTQRAVSLGRADVGSTRSGVEVATGAAEAG